LKSDEIRTLRKDRNPAFDFCDAEYWLAYKNGQVAGRIAAITNDRYVEKWGHRHARFGWVDFIDDADVSKALFDAAERWAAERGMTAIHGPLGFTDLDSEGMLVEGFDECATISTIYNHAYYPQHVEKLGYSRDIDWVEFQLVIPGTIPDRIKRIRKVVEGKNHLRLLTFKKRHELLPYARGVFDLLNTAYDGLYGFVPLTDKQIDMYVKQYFGYVKPDYVCIVLDSDDSIAAFAISMPSLAKAMQKAKGRRFPFGWFHLLKGLGKHNAVELCLIGIRPDLQGKGVNVMLMDEGIEASIRNNVVCAETNPELETNTNVQGQWKVLDHRQHKRRRCYIKRL